jgi:drug/metabolite transporter (DMT)-like permease
MMLYYAAISRVPLADAVGAHFIAPIVVTVLSGLLLKEHLTARRIVAVLLGFAGVLIMIRPGLRTDVGMLLAAASGTTFGFYIIVTRIVNVSRQVAPAIMLAFQYLLGAILLTPLVLSRCRHAARGLDNCGR